MFKTALEAKCLAHIQCWGIVGRWFVPRVLWNNLTWFWDQQKRRDATVNVCLWHPELNVHWMIAKGSLDGSGWKSGGLLITQVCFSLLVHTHHPYGNLQEHVLWSNLSPENTSLGWLTYSTACQSAFTD